MSALLHGLPPPVAMTLAHQAPPPATSPSSPSPQQQSKHHHQPQLHHQTHAPPQSYDIPELPPPPPWHPNGGDDIMRAWLLAKAETEKRRAEEERTHQDTIRLEQRRTEHDILRTSLAGGIPPPMVPIVFAGMGGGNLPQAALEWAHQFMSPNGPPALPQYMPPPHHTQQSQPQQQYPRHPQHLLPGSGATLHQPDSTRLDASAQQQQLSQGPPPRLPQQQQQQPQQSFYGQGVYGSGAREGGGPVTGLSQSGSLLPPDSPTPSHHREFALPGTIARPDRVGPPPPSGSSVAHYNLPTLGTGLGQQQAELQASPPILFHHWQPPGVSGSAGKGNSGGSIGGEDGGGSGGGGGGTGGSISQHSVPVGESPKKRKATGPQQSAPPPASFQQPRSPSFSHASGPSGNPSGARRRGHARQRSEMSTYRSAGRGGYGGRGGGAGGDHTPGISSSPYSSAPPSITGSLREGEEVGSFSHQQQPAQPRSGGRHTVSSLLSEEAPAYGSGNPNTPDQTSLRFSDRQRSPHTSGDIKRSGSASGDHGDTKD